MFANIVALPSPTLLLQLCSCRDSCVSSKRWLFQRAGACWVASRLQQADIVTVPSSSNDSETMSNDSRPHSQQVQLNLQMSSQLISLHIPLSHFVSRAFQSNPNWLLSLRYRKMLDKHANISSQLQPIWRFLQMRVPPNQILIISSIEPSNIWVSNLRNHHCCIFRPFCASYSRPENTAVRNQDNVHEVWIWIRPSTPTDSNKTHALAKLYWRHVCTLQGPFPIDDAVSCFSASWKFEVRGNARIWNANSKFLHCPSLRTAARHTKPQIELLNNMAP